MIIKFLDRFRKKDSTPAVSDERAEELRLLRFLNKNICPDCGHEGFWEGPRGAGSTNIKCQNDECGSEFNTYRDIVAQRISEVAPGPVWGYTKR